MGTPCSRQAGPPGPPHLVASCKHTVGRLPAWGAVLCLGPPPAAAALSPQVKELGAVIYNCSHLALDLEKTFQTYWVLGAPRAVLPRAWPQNFSSHINRFQPLRGRFDGVPTTAYFSVRGATGPVGPPGNRAPLQCPPGPQGHGLGSQHPGPAVVPWPVAGWSRQTQLQERTPAVPSMGDGRPGRGQGVL